MTRKRPSPLVGCNTAVEHRGAPYHIQTEDSGIDHPHVITHLFADGGRILATRKASYQQHVGTAAYPEVVRQIIRAQHQEMLVALRDGELDELLGHAPAPRRAPKERLDPEHGARPAGASTSSLQPPGPPRPRPPPPASEPAAAVRRPRRSSLAETEGARESLDEIIIADLAIHLDD